MSKYTRYIGKILSNEYIIISFILVLAIIVRLYKIHNPIADWHSWRQADTASVTRIYKEEGINLLYPKYYDVSSIQSGKFNPEGYRFVEFPIYNLLSVYFHKIFTIFSIEIASRLVSIFFSLFSALYLYLLGKKFIGKWGGVLAAFYFSFIPFNIYYSRTVLPEPAAVSFTLLSIWLFSIFIEKKNYYLLFLSAVFLSLGLLAKPYVIFYGIIYIYLLLKDNNFTYYKSKINRIYPLIVFGLIAFVPLFLWRHWISKYPEGIPFYAWVFNGNGIRFKPSYWMWLFGERVGFLILGSWGLIPLAFGIVKKIRETYFNQFFLLSALAYLIIVANANVMHDYYQIIIIPAIAYGLAQGTLVLWNLKDVNAYLGRGLLILSVGVMFITGWFQVRDYYNVNKWEIVEAGEAVDRIAEKDALVIAPYNGDTAFLYQTKRRGWPFRDRSLEELISRGADYFVSVALTDPQTIEAQDGYKIVEKNERYIIIDLHQKIK